MKENNPKIADRNLIIDAAKGYGILLVFLGHLAYYDSPLFRVIFNFHMPLFFLLSGTTFSPEKDADRKAILKRLWNTIGIPFVFFTLLGTFICAFTGRLMQHSLMDWLRAGASFFHGDPYLGGSLWFLTCLAVVKFLFWAWSKKSPDVRWNVGLLVAAYIVGCVFGNLVNPKILLGGPLMCFSVPMAFFFFAIGYYCRGVLRRIQVARYAGLIVLSVLCLVVEIVLALLYPSPNMAIPEFPSPHTFLPASLCGIGAILCLSVKSFSAVRFIGRYSLYYFLMERWVRGAWFAIADRLLPGFISHGADGNPNLMHLTAVQTVATVVALIVIVTALLPILRFLLSMVKTTQSHGRIFA